VKAGEFSLARNLPPSPCPLPPMGGEGSKRKKRELCEGPLAPHRGERDQGEGGSLQDADCDNGHLNSVTYRIP